MKLTCGLIILVLIVPALAEKGSARSSGNEKQPAPAQASSQQSERGQLVFEQNCSRCHNAPESFPPQISGTIIRHMRVRASLSAADEKALLHFLNP